MDHPLFDLIEQKIRAAEDAGEFDNLEGAGKPLPKVDDPEFVRLSRELKRLRDELAETGDRTRRQDIMKEMSMMDAQIELARKGRY